GIERRGSRGAAAALFQRDDSSGGWTDAEHLGSGGAEARVSGGGKAAEILRARGRDLVERDPCGGDLAAWRAERAGWVGEQRHRGGIGCDRGWSNAGCELVAFAAGGDGGADRSGGDCGRGAHDAGDIVDSDDRA